MPPERTTTRARDLGLPFNGTPGSFNAITDVPDTAVGLKTIIENEPRAARNMPVRTGVTAIVPGAGADEPSLIWAGIHRFNGNGEMTGSHWIADGGYFVGPVVLTNTHAVGIAHHAAVKWMLRRYPGTYGGTDPLWLMPVVAETYDGFLNDINGQPVIEDDVLEALDGAKGGAVVEGNTGGGTGMICYEFKGGTGTASRLVEVGGKTFTVGALVQANFGIRDWLTVLGTPVGRHLTHNRPFGGTGERGSIIGVIGTDLPLAPHQLSRIARRGALGIGRTGTVGGNGSGDIFLAFSVGNRTALPHRADSFIGMEIVNDERLDPVYEAVVQSVEEAVINAMVAATPMGGTQWDRALVSAIDHRALIEIVGRSRGLQG
ncbi:P1 family peptidase [Mesorhizobium sp. LHD-90]|uniref:DmpA family aminopeptidase n=1 Tax=Mesorhizobium sp. LHD-90 TaxID=3071414 RepID=UPI0027DF5BD6|nr:P1 family peptidase [Mesorhizobium sp. LHD-90]MDQ6437507.1 P1 family peptidase [Mesorhizobium sp. LHD-90]